LAWWQSPPIISVPRGPSSCSMSATKHCLFMCPFPTCLAQCWSEFG
jgi:hypothetical protein